MSDPEAPQSALGPREWETAYRLLSCVAAATYADALDEQLRRMLGEAFATSGDPVDVSDDGALGRAIEKLAVMFRDEATLPET